MLEKIANPLGFSQSLGVPGSSSSRARRGLQRPPGRPGRIPGDKIPSRDNTVPDLVGGLLERGAEERPDATGTHLEPLVREWLADLRIQGRSDLTVDWYRRRMSGYLRGGKAQTLDRLTSSELKRYLADLQGRGLSPEPCTVASRRSGPSLAGPPGRATRSTPRCSGYDRPRFPKRRWRPTPKLSSRQSSLPRPEGWPRLAILMLLGTGMRVGELCSLTLEDIEATPPSLRSGVARAPSSGERQSAGGCAESWFGT